MKINISHHHRVLSTLYSEYVKSCDTREAHQQLFPLLNISKKKSLELCVLDNRISVVT